MRILVTGGGGFLGRAIVDRLLESGHEIAILGRSPHADLEARGITPFYGDLADADFVARAVECSRCEAVFHVAAKAGVWGSWDAFYQPNVIGTRNVIGACRDHRIRYLVYTSTPSVVFNRTPFRDADESQPYGRDWLCHYAHTKAIAEREILAAHHADHLRSVALRPHLIWGIGDPHLIPRVIDRARQGRLRIVGDGCNRVDITHVKNAAAAHLDALDALCAGRAGGRAYFISQGEPVVLWDWLNGLLERIDVPPITRKISLRKAYLMGAILEAIYRLLPLSGEPPMTRFVALELGKDHFFSLRAARRDLHYEPVVDTENGLRELAEHILSGAES